MSTRLTEQLITYGLSTATVNALSDGGYWNLDTLLDAVKTWRTEGWHGIALYEFLNVAGIGPTLNAELMTALENHANGMPSPWAPNPGVGELVNEIVADIHGGTIRHGDPLTPASHLVLQRGIKAAAASTTHRLLAARGFLAMRSRRAIALTPWAEPYEVRWCPSISEHSKAKAADAVALARQHPGLWQRARLCRSVHDILRPLHKVEYDDAARVMIVLVADWRP